MLREIDRWVPDIAEQIAGRCDDLSGGELENEVRRVIDLAAFLWLCRRRGMATAEVFDRAASGLPIKAEELVRRIDRLDQHAPKHPPSTGILGDIHDRLLRWRIQRLGSGDVRVELDQQARRARGIYYTPEYVVDYIVGGCLDGRIEERPKILDPACGCGAFLIGAYRYLLRAYRREYLTGDVADRPDVLRHDSDGRWQLTPDERLRILRQHIYGVDRDAGAVTVARRSLWLEAMTPGDPLFCEEMLTENVQVGDALTGEPLAGREGQFDVVLGNPPYLRELDRKDVLDRIARTEFGRRYRAPRMDLWYYFVHRGLELLRAGGTLSYIVNAYWSSGSGAERLIAALRESARIEELFLLEKLRIFPGVSGRHMILRLAKSPAAGFTTIKRAPADIRTDAEPFVRGESPVVTYRKTAEQLFRAGRLDLEPPADRLLEKLSRWPALETLGIVRQGIAENPATINAKTNRKFAARWTTGEGVFTLTPDEVAQLHLPPHEQQLLRPYHDLCDLGRYQIAPQPSRMLIYSTGQTCPDIDEYPVLRAHLERFQPVMEARRETRRGTRAWWQLHWPRDERLWQSAKVISVQMARRPSFVAAMGPVYVPFSTNVFVPFETTREHPHYFAALLNSRLLWQWYEHHAKRRGVGLEINGRVLARTPIRPIDFSHPADRRRHDQLVELVAGIQNTRDAETVEELDQQIDGIVVELYDGLPARRKEPG
ncbi:MAG: N-6 DNA methylase [Planctomycetes bacterium]|nr:N-6 DNA methylase [Planctomycetota bacterium]